MHYVPDLPQSFRPSQSQAQLASDANTIQCDGTTASSSPWMLDNIVFSLRAQLPNALHSEYPGCAALIHAVVLGVSRHR